MSTGSRKVVRSMPAVTTRQLECLIAARAAASSQSFITVPPCTKPAELASWIDIQRTRTACESAAGRGSTAPDGYASRSDRESDHRGGPRGRHGRTDVHRHQGEDQQAPRQ